MKTQTILTVKKENADKVNIGDIVKLGRLCNNDSGICITKTATSLTILVDNGCYDFQIK
jgi:hypothetical protein